MGHPGIKETEIQGSFTAFRMTAGRGDDGAERSAEVMGDEGGARG
jgi:hypothetical protein